MILVLSALTAIVILYFVLAIVFSQLGVKICAVCAAVSAVWLGLLFGYYFDWHSNQSFVGILMGASVVGLMYRTERLFKKKNLSNFWLIRLYILVFGFLGAYLILISRFDILLLVVFVVIILGFLSFTQIYSQRYGKNKAIGWKEKLEKCCD